LFSIILSLYVTAWVVLIRERAAVMPAIARDLDAVAGVFAALATVLFIVGDQAPASRVRAFS
jgi:hypothetical protein